MLDRILSRFNLGPAETAVYLALLESGAITAGSLAKRVDIPRSSLYGLLDNLTATGLVLQSEREGTKLWRIESPERISELIDSRINNWEHAKTQFESLLPHLLAKQPGDLVTPHFSYFEGNDGVKHILRDMLCYRNLVTQAFWPISDMIEMLGEDFFNELNVQRIRQNLYTQAIWPENKLVDIKKNIFLGVGDEFLREIRRAPKGIDCSMGYWAYQNKVAFVSSRKESFGFIIESVEFRQLLKTQFDVLWQMSTPLQVALEHTKVFLERI